MANFFRAAKSLHYSLDHFAIDHDRAVQSQDFSYVFTISLDCSTGLRGVFGILDLVIDQCVKTLFVRKDINPHHISLDLNYNIRSGLAKVGCPKVGPQPRSFKKKHHGRPIYQDLVALPVMALDLFEGEFKPSKITKVPVPLEFSSNFQLWPPLLYNREMGYDLKLVIIYNVDAITLFSHITIDDRVVLGFGYSYNGFRVSVAGGTDFTRVYTDAFYNQMLDVSADRLVVIHAETEWFHGGRLEKGKMNYLTRVSIGADFWNGVTDVSKDDFIGILTAGADESTKLLATTAKRTYLMDRHLFMIQTKCVNIWGRFQKAVKNRFIVDAVERVLQILAPSVRNLVVALFLFALFRSRLSLDEQENVILV